MSIVITFDLKILYNYFEGILAKNKWKIAKHNNITFFFKYDPDAPELLHVYVRHLMTIPQALWIWFNGKTVENKIYKRFETSTDKHCLYWAWKNESTKEVMIISCFERN